MTGKLSTASLLLIVGVAGIVSAAFGAAVAGKLAWRNPPPLPSSTQATAVVQRFLPAQSMPEVTRTDFVFGYDPPADQHLLDRVVVSALGGDGYQAGGVKLTFRLAGDPPQILDQVRRGMAPAGWRTTEVSADMYGREFAAADDRLITSWSITNHTGDWGVVPNGFDRSLVVEINRRAPAGVGSALVIGWWIGLGIGVLLGGLLALRLRSMPRGARRAWLWAYWLSMALLLPFAAITSMGPLAYLLPVGAAEIDTTAPWVALMMFGIRPMTLLGLVGITVVVIGCTLAKPGTETLARETSDNDS